MLGRRDGMTANFDGAQNLPSPTDPLDDLTQKFADLGLDDTDFVALQGIFSTRRDDEPAKAYTRRSSNLAVARSRDELRTQRK